MTGSEFLARASVFWNRLRKAGVQVRVFNPRALTDPFWIRRNHRKVITVDGTRSFVAGLCVSNSWKGSDVAEPWRDTGLSIAGPVVADLDAAFASWARAGMPLDQTELLEPKTSVRGRRRRAGDLRPAGDVRTYRFDQFIASMAQRNLWLTDAYFVATHPTSRLWSSRPRRCRRAAAGFGIERCCGAALCSRRLPLADRGPASGSSSGTGR